MCASTTVCMSGCACVCWHVCVWVWARVCVCMSACLSTLSVCALNFSYLHTNVLALPLSLPPSPTLPLPVCRESMFALRFVLFAINQKNKKKQSEREWEKGEEGQRKIGDKIKKLSMTAALAILFGHLCTVPPHLSFASTLLVPHSLCLSVLISFHFRAFCCFLFHFPLTRNANEINSSRWRWNERCKYNDSFPLSKEGGGRGAGNRPPRGMV